MAVPYIYALNSPGTKFKLKYGKIQGFSNSSSKSFSVGAYHVNLNFVYPPAFATL